MIESSSRLPIFIPFRPQHEESRAEPELEFQQPWMSHKWSSLHLLLSPSQSVPLSRNMWSSAHPAKKFNKQSLHHPISLSCLHPHKWIANISTFNFMDGAQPSFSLIRLLSELRPRTPSGPGMWWMGSFLSSKPRTISAISFMLTISSLPMFSGSRKSDFVNLIQFDFSLQTSNSKPRRS